MKNELVTIFADEGKAKEEMVRIWIDVSVEPSTFLIVEIRPISFVNPKANSGILNSAIDQ